MKKFKFGFILDPPEKIKCLEDTSFYIMKEAHERGHEVVYIDSKDLFLEGPEPFAAARVVAPNETDGFKILRSIDRLALARLDLAFIRKDPPFDSHYLFITQALESLSDRIAVVNDPAGLRKANEKLYILHFPEWIPETIIASDPRLFDAFAGRIGDTVLKPLFDRGGAGVLKISKNDPAAGSVIRRALSEYGTLMAQRFIPEVTKSGDKRVLILNGSVLGGYARIPPRGDFRVSIERDGRYEPLELTERERKIARSLGPCLVRDGLFFVGLDLIGGFLSEINITSPAGIPESNHFLGRKLEADVVSFLESAAGKSLRTPPKR